MILIKKSLTSSNRIGVEELAISATLFCKKGSGETEQKMISYVPGQVLKAGDYTLKVQATDRLGNECEATSTMRVQAKAQPDPENPEAEFEIQIPKKQVVVPLGSTEAEVLKGMRVSRQGQKLLLRLREDFNLNQLGAYEVTVEALDPLSKEVLLHRQIRVSFDGQTLDPKNYELRRGSTIVRFKPEFLATLSEGVHSVCLLFTNDRRAEGTLTISSDLTGGKQAQRRLPVTGEAYPTLPLFSAVLLLGVLLLARKKLH